MIRQPTVAGRFYPADPAELRATIRRLLRQAAADGPDPKALVLPHAAYAYSGAIAASGYARLLRARRIIRRIVLIGPAHFVPLTGVAFSSATAFATPLGEVPVDRIACETIGGLPGVVTADLPHAAEHSLEVHLPFLQEALDAVRIVPLAVGRIAPARMGRVLEALWDGASCRLIVSSDLSHYHAYETAMAVDRRTARAIERLAPMGVGERRACGCDAINGLLWVARRLRLRVETLDLRNSGDTAGPRDCVVGYGAFAFFRTTPLGGPGGTALTPKASTRHT
jgi:AmmeMemoRadiSam system protein B